MRNTILAVVGVLFVLGFASLAGAYPIISGPTTIDGAGTYTYTVVGQANDNCQGGIFVNLATYGYDPGGMPTGLTITNVSGMLKDPTSGMERMGQTASGVAKLDGSYYHGIAFLASNGTIPVPVLAGDWFTFDIVATSSVATTGSITIDVSESDYATIDNSLSVLLPEPATMALLGLGGLLLRKRKK